MLRLRANFSDPTQVQFSFFDVITSFDALDPKRKLVLCDQLFHAGPKTYRTTVKLFWPQSTVADAKVLEKYLRRKMVATAAV